MDLCAPPTSPPPKLRLTCTHPACQALVDRMIHVSGGSGWMYVWALHIVAGDRPIDAVYDELCGNAVACVEAALQGWQPEDEAGRQALATMSARIRADFPESDADQ